MDASGYRIGVDLGGTKIELVVLQKQKILMRERLPTPANNYMAILQTIADLVECAKSCIPEDAMPKHIGIGMPGAITSQHQVKNSNTKVLNGQAFPADIQRSLGMPVRIMNDANCFALSEAVDGAAAGCDVVFGVILGTGVGGGLVVHQQALKGCNAIAGEWGHMPLPISAPRLNASRRACYCGKYDCIETYLCGKGLQLSYQEMTGQVITNESLVERLLDDDAVALRLYRHYQLQLAASLALVVNVLDPDSIVLGGGLSNLPDLAKDVQAHLADYVFSDTVMTSVVRNQHGDSSGVRGAAWL